MSKQVDFYLIGNQVADAKYKLAARLCNKIQRLNKRALVVTGDAKATNKLDQLLWTFSDASFVAHDSLKDRDAISSIHIGEISEVSSEVLQANYDVLVNLADDAPPFSHQFNRVAEIVEPVASEKAAARRRFKNYRDEGFELKTHDLEL